MAFKPVQDLDADVTVALGGVDKKTGKKNPTKVEGYYLGSRDTASKKSKNGISKLYFFQTEQGNLGVWGKTDLDRKMLAVKPGTMTRVTQSGSVPTPNGDMYKFKVEVDEANSIEVDFPTNNETAESNDEQESANAYSSSEDEGDEEAETPELVDEPVLARPSKPARAATTPDAARQARVQALFNGGKNFK